MVGAGDQWPIMWVFWLCGCGAASPPLKEVGPAPVFEAAFDGEHDVGSRFRPTAPGSFEPAPDDAFAGAFHESGSDRQAAHPAEVVSHSVPVGLAGADAVRERRVVCRYFCNFDQECQDLVSGSMPSGEAGGMNSFFRISDPVAEGGRGPAPRPRRLADAARCVYNASAVTSAPEANRDKAAANEPLSIL